MAQTTKNGEIVKAAPQPVAHPIRHAMVAFEDRFKALLPKHLPFERFQLSVIMALQKDANLARADPRKIIAQALVAAQIGCDIAPAMKEGYLVTFKDEVQLLTDYRFLVKVAKQTGVIADAWAYCVYKDDEFDWSLGTEPRVVHKPKLGGSRQPGDIVAAYCVALLPNGSKHVEVMNREEIERVRASSRMANGATWTQHYDRMAVKTVVRRCMNLLRGASQDFARVMAVDDAEDEGRVMQPDTDLGLGGDPQVDPPPPEEPVARQERPPMPRPETPDPVDLSGLM